MKILSPATLFPGNSAMHRLVQAEPPLADRFFALTAQHTELRAIVRHALESTLATAILWGPERILLYNDVYIQFLSQKHPAAFMTPARQVWAEIWPQVSPFVDRAFAGEAFCLTGQRFVIARDERMEEAWFSVYFTPLRDDDDRVIAITSSAVEITEQVVAERRQALLLELAEPLRRAADDAAMMRATAYLVGAYFGLGTVFHAAYRCAGEPPGVRPLWPAGDGSAAAHCWPTLPPLPASPAPAAGDVFAIEQLHAAGSAASPLPSGSRVAAAAALLAVLRSDADGTASVLVLCPDSPRAWSANDILVAREVALQLQQAIARRADLADLGELQQSLETRIAQRTAELDTEQSRARELAATYQFMLSSARIGDWDLDLSNDAATRSLRHDQCFGYHEPIANWGFEQFIAHVHPADRVDVQRRFEQALGGTREWHFEARVIWPDASVHWIEAHGTVYNNATGPQRMVGIVADITERKHVEAALRQADLRKNEFLATLAHELRNPLAPIASAASVLQFGRHLDQQRLTQTGQIIERQVKHMAGLIEGLLDVSRVTRGMVALSSERLDFRTVFAHAAEQAQPLFDRKKHRFVAPSLAAPAWIEGDADRLVQVFANLLVNAAKFTPDGGHIIATAVMHQGMLALSISDNGIGIASDFLPRVFDLFAQDERANDGQRGLGIGLALVHSLVALHGGSVDVTSAGPGSGSTFTVQLPLASQQLATAQAAPAPGSPRPPAATPLELLIVDDNIDAADMLAMFARALGHRATVVHDARHALQVAAAAPPDLCFLDIGLPEIDGIALARALRELPATAACRLIAVTGYAGSGDRDRALAAGFDDYFVKPVDADKLAALLGQA
jgi:PAS domain S-box-containing protein